MIVIYPCPDTQGLVNTGFHLVWFVWFMVINATFNIISVIYIMAVSFIGGGNRSTRRKSPTCRKSQTNFITYLVWDHRQVEIHDGLNLHNKDIKAVEQVIMTKMRLLYFYKNTFFFFIFHRRNFFIEWLILSCQLYNV